MKATPINLRINEDTVPGALPTASETQRFNVRIESLIGRERLDRYSICDLFNKTHLNHTAEQIIAEFCEFNRHAASNVLRLAADLIDNATHKSDANFQLFGEKTSVIAGLVLRAAADEELGSAAHGYTDPHDALMSFTLSLINNNDIQFLPSSGAISALDMTDQLYRAVGTNAHAFCYRLGVHLASEYSASEEFASIAGLLHDRAPNIEAKLKCATHPIWSDVNGLTWIACHEEVEIGHAKFALEACELALDCLPETLRPPCLTKLKQGFEDFYRNRKTFFQGTLS